MTDLDLDEDRFLTTMYAADLRIAWRDRRASALAYLGGVSTQIIGRAAVVFAVRSGPRVMVWRKRGVLQWVKSPTNMSSQDMMRLDASPLKSWAELEALVAGLYADPERRDQIKAAVLDGITPARRG